MDSLNDIRLTPKMIVAMYGQVLVAPADHTAVKKPVPAPEIPLKYLGNNEKKVVVMVNSPGNTYLSDKELVFLTKILEACRLIISDVAIVNMANPQNAGADVQAILSPAALICFGTDESATLYAPAIVNDIQVVHAPLLKSMVTDTPEAKQMKGKLWVALKQMFGL